METLESPVTVAPAVGSSANGAPAQTWSPPPRGKWTYDDYLHLPNDGKRYEIIDGVLYVANAPSYDHQFAATQLTRILANFVAERSLGVVIAAPFEVHLGEHSSPVQPDVLFIAAERQPAPGTQFFAGAPDLVVEVVSPSSVRTDNVIKFTAYERAGVREYWLVNPQARNIAVFVKTSETTTNELENAADKQWEFKLHGQFQVGEPATSSVLEGLSVDVAKLFA